MTHDPHRRQLLANKFPGGQQPTERKRNDNLNSVQYFRRFSFRRSFVGIPHIFGFIHITVKWSAIAQLFGLIFKNARNLFASQIFSVIDWRWEINGSVSVICLSIAALTGERRHVITVMDTLVLFGKIMMRC